MSESKKVVAKRRPTKGEDKIRKIQMFKETANNAISDATEFDKAILESNEAWQEYFTAVITTQLQKVERA